VEENAAEFSASALRSPATRKRLTLTVSGQWKLSTIAPLGRPTEVVEMRTPQPTTLEELKDLSDEQLASWEAELRPIEEGKAG
jgi:hypothetical protein